MAFRPTFYIRWVDPESGRVVRMERVTTDDMREALHEAQLEIVAAEARA